MQLRSHANRPKKKKKIPWQKISSPATVWGGKETYEVGGDL